VGLVVKNSSDVDFTNRLIRAVWTRILHLARRRIRLRPILMTTIALVLVACHRRSAPGRGEIRRALSIHRNWRPDHFHVLTLLVVDGFSLWSRRAAVSGFFRARTAALGWVVGVMLYTAARCAATRSSGRAPREPPTRRTTDSSRL